MENHNTSEEFSPPRKVWKRVRPKKFKVADKATLERILNPPPRYPEPEFKGQEYVHGAEIDSQYIFMCNQPGCSAKFTTDISLNLHIRSKHRDPNYKCLFCNLTLQTAEDLTKHCSEFHPDLEKNPDANPLQCKKCGKCSRDKKALWRHVRESHRGRQWSCPQCNFAFTRPENLKQHNKSMHPTEEITHECKICGKKYRHKNSLRGHYRLQHRGKEKSETSYTCVLCKTVYDNLPAYERHMKRHVNPKYFPCHICNVTFGNSGHLKRHEASKIHAIQMKKVVRKKPTEDLFPAPVIKTVKTANPNLSKEELIELCNTVKVKIILHRVDNGIVYKTKVLPGVRARQRQLKRMANKREQSKTQSPPPRLLAEENETADQYLNCFYCEKELPNLQAVKFHEKACLMRLRNPKVNICSVCNMEFAKPHQLKVHALRHSNEKPFKCSFCDSYFKRRYTKYLHEKARHFHIRGKQYKRIYRCNYKECHKQYSNSTGLKAHITGVHLRIRHPCEQCGRLFKSDVNLRRHLKHVHADCPTLLECKPCNRMYTTKHSYLVHLERKRHFRKTREYERRRNRKRVVRKSKMLQIDEENSANDTISSAINKTSEPIAVSLK